MNIKGKIVTLRAMEIEGVRRKAVFKGNDYYDEIIVGVLRDEYFELIRNNNYWDK